jgi:arginase
MKKPLDPVIALLGVPYDEKSSFYRGAAAAPPLIREWLYIEASNLWTENEFNLGVENLLFDAGDLDLKDSQEPFHDIETAVANLLEQELKPIILGGDHAITYPVLRAFSGKYSRLSLLQFDAHPDLYDEFEGDRYSHACPFARVMEDGLVDRLVQVGIRSLNRHQREQAEKFGVEMHLMKDWREATALDFDSPLYISFDMDVLDPAFAPGLSHREPGGFSTRRVIAMIQSLQAPIVGADIVEFNPSRDVYDLTAVTCAKILKEIAGKMLETVEGE